MAKNFDSVFADCTDDELEFDTFFDDDDSILDFIAGVDEAGELFTGEDFDFSSLLEEDDMVGENPDFDYQKNGDLDASEKDAEGATAVKPEVGGEVGDKKEVSGTQNSAEANADKEINTKDFTTATEATTDATEDTDSEEFTDDKNSSNEPTKAEDEKCCKESSYASLLEADEADDVDDTEEDAEDGVDEAAFLEALLNDLNESGKECEDGECEEEPKADVPEDEGCCKEGCEDGECAPETEDPLTDDDEAERAGEVSQGAVATESYVESLLDSLNEAEDPIEDPCDTGRREGAIKTNDGTEGESQEQIAASIVGSVNSDPLVDIDDAELRDGSKKLDSSDTEGEKVHTVAAALEADDYMDELLELLDDDDTLDYENEIVPDEIGDQLTDNADIDVKESVEEELVEEDPDDTDIEAVANDKSDEGESDMDYEYGDDELIDAVINGDIEDL